jgi:TrmH family RNA methyltransferase
MLSKSQIKFITRLKQKKYRAQEGLFIAEGLKTVNELLDSSLELHHVFATNSFNSYAEKQTIISEAELKKISSLKAPNTVLAVFKIPEPKPILNTGLIVALDAVRDPGNLGTIIRLCDWFGVKELVCSEATVECYNSKVIQATMGSITRVNVTYTDLETFLEETDVPVFGAYMDGENVYTSVLPKKGILVMGNEANGISEAIEERITQRIAIPRFGDVQATESLNVATATAILLSEFKRG